jgi:hypothetical protein
MGRRHEAAVILFVMARYGPCSIARGVIAAEATKANSSLS